MLDSSQEHNLRCLDGYTTFTAHTHTNTDTQASCPPTVLWWHTRKELLRTSRDFYKGHWCKSQDNSFLLLTFRNKAQIGGYSRLTFELILLFGTAHSATRLKYFNIQDILLMWVTCTSSLHLHVFLIYAKSVMFHNTASGQVHNEFRSSVAL